MWLTGIHTFKTFQEKSILQLKNYLFKGLSFTMGKEKQVMFWICALSALEYLLSRYQVVFMF